MEIGKQIKKYRNDFNFSQEELAEKVYVSRQTISNWENDKNYPDIKSLLLLSSVFEISLDTLVKGDVDMMKEQIIAIEITEEEFEKFKKDAKIFNAMFFYVIIFTVPALMYLGLLGKILTMTAFVVLFYYSVRVEKLKKAYNINTYKEIVAFLENETLDDVEKYKEEGKKTYQKIAIVILVTLMTGGFIFGSVMFFNTDTWSNMLWGYKFLAILQFANTVVLLSSFNELKQTKEIVQLKVLAIGLTLLHLMLTIFVGIEILAITPVQYCVISLFILCILIIAYFFIDMQKKRVEK